jgi:uncharacterized protein
MIGKLDPTQIEEFLASQMLGRIGCHYNDLTYVVPISYTYSGKYVYAISFEGMKIDMMRKNPKVCFQVDVLSDMLNWKCVIAWGVFEELLEESDRKEGLSILTNRSLPLISSVVSHHQPTWPFIEKDPEKIAGVVFRIHLTEKTGRYETNSAPIMFTV